MPAQDSRVLRILREVDGLLEDRLRSLSPPTSNERKDLARDTVQLRLILSTITESFDCYLSRSEHRDTDGNSEEGGGAPPEFALDFNYEVVCVKIETGGEPTGSLIPIGFRSTSSPADGGSQ